jgi:DNA-binding PadR family transcriptional regulator
MTAISVNNELDFNGLKELLDVTDGNLATHLRMLQKEEFIRVEKTFVDNKPNTKYYITKRGKAVFKKHLKALENIITVQK